MSFAAITGRGGPSLIVRVLGLTQAFFAACAWIYVRAPWFKHGAFYQPFNLAFGACGLYCLIAGRFPFLERIGRAVAGRRRESGANQLGLLNLILTTIVFIDTFFIWV